MDRFPRDVVFLLDRSSAKTSKWKIATVCGVCVGRRGIAACQVLSTSSFSGSV